MGVTSERQCDICNIGFPTEYSLREHRLSLMHHKILNHQLRNQGVHDPEHFCFLCQRSMRFNAWADHLLDPSHRQRVLSMKTEEQTAGLCASPTAPLWGRPASCDLLPMSSGGSGIAAAQPPGEQSSTDSDWLPRRPHLHDQPHQHLQQQQPRVASRLLDTDTEALLKKTQALLRNFAARQRQERQQQERRQPAAGDDITPISSLNSSARSSDALGGAASSATSDLSRALTSGASSSTRQRIRRRAIRRSTAQSSSLSSGQPKSPCFPVIEPVVRLPPASGAPDSRASASPFQFGLNEPSRGFNFSFPAPNGASAAVGSTVTRMQRALLLSKEEEALRAQVAQVDERLEVLNGRVEQLLNEIAAEEEVKDKLRVKEMELHSRRMDILKTICVPRPDDDSVSLEDEDEEEELGARVLNLGLDSGRSASPDGAAMAVPELHIGDQTRRDILSKVMEAQQDVDDLLDSSPSRDGEDSVSREVDGPGSDSSSDTVRLVQAATHSKGSDERRASSRDGAQSSTKSPLRRHRDPALSALMKEYLHNNEPSSSDVDLEQTPRSPVAAKKGNLSDNLSGISTTASSLPSTAAHVFPGVITAHDAKAVLDLCVYKGYLYSAGEDAIIRKFSLQSHECLCEYRGHSQLVHCIALSDQSKGEDRLFSGGFDNALFIFNVKTGAEAQRCVFDAAVHTLAVAWAVLHIGLANGRLLAYSLAQRCLQPGPRSLSARPITCLTPVLERACLLVGADGDGVRVVARGGAVLLHILPTEMDLLPLAVLHCAGRIVTFHEQCLLCYDCQTGALRARLELPVRVSCLAQTATHVLVGTVAGRVHSLPSGLLLQEGDSRWDEAELGAEEVQISAANEAILTMTCHQDTLLVGDEKGRITIRQMV